MSSKDSTNDSKSAKFLPATDIMVPEMMPRLIWEHLRRHRVDQSVTVPKSLGAPANSTPFTWEECGDKMATLCTRLNELNEQAEQATATLNAAAENDTAADAAPTESANKKDQPAPAANDQKPSAEAEQKPEETEKSSAEEKKSADDTTLRIKCSRPSCNVMSSKEKPLLNCARCRIVHYCSRECQKQDWPQHKRLCKPTSEKQQQERNMKQALCTKLLEEVIPTDFVLIQNLCRQRFGPGAMIVGMRDLLDLTRDTANQTRQVWFTYATLKELAELKQIDGRLVDAECAVREMFAAEDAGTPVVARDFFVFLDDKEFGCVVGFPRLVATSVGEALYADAAKEMRSLDMYAIDMATQRRYVIRFSDFEITVKDK